ncbi:hypothetical protein WJX72_000258 [[Myrmecia] bisecta]|uniref:BACK domain-containing protein n=1 Tax=[Myrmecia] bisecta TaxID=41462 RepID=A0AAW1Q6C1_9CHLO
MVSALKCLASANTSQNVEAISSAVPLGATLANDASVLTSEEAHLTLLVLKDVVEPAHPMGEGEATRQGFEVVDCLKQAVYGEGSTSQHIMQSVYSESFNKATVVHAACIALLKHTVLNMSTCFILLGLAHACNIPTLCRAAEALVLSDFVQAVTCDPDGFSRLPKTCLLKVISHDSLQVASESDVFNALVTWVEADRTARLADFAGLLAAGVRVMQMDLASLFQLDVHPLVHASRSSLRLVAHAYLSKCLGMTIHHDSSCNADIRNTPRHARRAAPRIGGPSLLTEASLLVLDSPSTLGQAAGTSPSWPASPAVRAEACLLQHHFSSAGPASEQGSIPSQCIARRLASHTDINTAQPSAMVASAFGPANQHQTIEEETLQMPGVRQHLKFEAEAVERQQVPSLPWELATSPRRRSVKQEAPAKWVEAASSLGSCPTPGSTASGSPPACRKVMSQPSGILKRLRFQ